MRLSRVHHAMLAIVLTIGLVGCQQLFTTSLGTPLARGSLPIPSNLSTDQAAALAAQAKANQDPALATALVTGLLTQLTSTTDPSTKAALGSSAASAAIIASGVGTKLSDTITAAATTGTIDPATLPGLLTTIQGGATASVVLALSLFSDPAVLASPASSGLSATDLAIAAVVIAASAIPPGSDPQTFNPATATPSQQATFTTAQTILASAKVLAGTDPNVTSLLNKISGSFSL